MFRRFMNFLFCFFLLCLPFAYMFLLIAVGEDKAKRDAQENAVYAARKYMFFKECILYEPKYKCDLKWKELE